MGDRRDFFPGSGISGGLKRGLPFGNTLKLEYQQSLEYPGNGLQIYLELIKTKESLLLLDLHNLGINYFTAVPGFSCLGDGSRSGKKRSVRSREKKPQADPSAVGSGQKSHLLGRNSSL